MSSLVGGPCMVGGLGPRALWALLYIRPCTTGIPPRLISVHVYHHHHHHHQFISPIRP